MMNMQTKKTIITFSILVIGSCVVLLLYMTLFRWVDFENCITPIASKAGVPSTMDELDGIESYILDTAIPGMEREKVLEILEGLGPVDVRFHSVSYPPGKFRDTIFIKPCMHPFNNLEIYAFYSSDGNLISISLLNND